MLGSKYKKIFFNFNVNKKKVLILYYPIKGTT